MKEREVGLWLDAMRNNPDLYTSHKLIRVNYNPATKDATPYFFCAEGMLLRALGKEYKYSRLRKVGLIYDLKDIVQALNDDSKTGYKPVIADVELALEDYISK